MWETTIVYRGNIGMMEKKLETTIVYRGNIGIMEKKMETTIVYRECRRLQLHLSRDLIIWEFPKIRGTFLGVPIIRTLIYLGLYWGPLILGNYHIAPVLREP